MHPTLVFARFAFLSALVSIGAILQERTARLIHLEFAKHERFDGPHSAQGEAITTIVCERMLARAFVNRCRSAFLTWSVK